MPTDDALRHALLHLDLPAVDQALAAGASLRDPVLGHAPLMLLLRHRQNVGDAPVRALLVPLVARGADLNAVDENGRSVLYHAAETGDWDTVRVLTDLGAHDRAPVPDGHHGELLEKAVQTLDLDLVERLVTAGHPKPTPEATNGMGFSLLHVWASATVAQPPEESGRPLLDRLLAWGLPVNAQHRVTQATPLMLAVKGQHLARVNALLDAGADPHLGMIASITPGLAVRRYTPLHWAAARNHSALVARLLAAGASPHAPVALSNTDASDVITPLSEAREHQAMASLALLEAAVLQDSLGTPESPILARPRL